MAAVGMGGFVMHDETTLSVDDDLSLDVDPVEVSYGSPVSTQQAQLEPSVINRLFNTYTKLEAIAPAPAPVQITRITHHEIKAMKEKATIAEQSPELLFRRSCKNPFGHFCLGLTSFLHDMFPVKTD